MPDLLELLLFCVLSLALFHGIYPCIRMENSVRNINKIHKRTKGLTSVDRIKLIVFFYFCVKYFSVFFFFLFRCKQANKLKIEFKSLIFAFYDTFCVYDSLLLCSCAATAELCANSRIAYWITSTLFNMLCFAKDYYN